MTKIYLPAIFGILAIGALCLPSHALAQIDITFSSNQVEVGADETLTLLATGTGDITEFQLTLVVEDGGTALGGSATDPTIASTEFNDFVADGTSLQLI